MRRITLAIALVALGVCSVLAQEPKPKFEVASVKPQTRPFTMADVATGGPRVRPGGMFGGTHATVASLVMFAHDLKDYQLSGGPEWVRQSYFDVNAKAESPDASAAEMRLMVQSLLEERFALVTHKERRDMDHLALVLARQDGSLGPFLQGVQECSREGRAAAEEKFPPRARTDGGGMTSGCGPLASFAQLLSMQMKMPVIDRTGLGGNWLHSTRFGGAMTGIAGPGNASTPADPSLPPFDVALEEQLGLKLEPARGPIEVLIIDSVQQPTEN